MLLKIIIKELKELFRNINNHILMIVFPLALMFIIGNALSALSGNTLNIKDDFKPVAIYIAEENNYNLESFGEVLEELNVPYIYVNDKEKYIDLVNAFEYGLLITYENNSINFHHNAYYDLNNQIVKTVMQGFLDYQLAINEIINENIIPITYEQINEYIIPIENKPYTATSLDYYGLTMLIMIICYGAETYDVVTLEYHNHTMKRLELTPIKKMNIFFGKLIGIITTVFTQIICVVLFAKFVLKVNYGNNHLLLFGVLFSLSLAFISIGLALVLIIKDEKKTSNIINIFIVVMNLLAGIYFQIDLGFLNKLSPLLYVKEALLYLIYRQNITPSLIAILANLTIFIGCIIIATFMYGKSIKYREVINYD